MLRLPCRNVFHSPLHMLDRTWPCSVKAPPGYKQELFGASPHWKRFSRDIRMATRDVSKQRTRAPSPRLPAQIRRWHSLITAPLRSGSGSPWQGWMTEALVTAYRKPETAKLGPLESTYGSHLFCRKLPNKEGFLHFWGSTPLQIHQLDSSGLNIDAQRRPCLLHWPPPEQNFKGQLRCSQRLDALTSHSPNLHLDMLSNWGPFVHMPWRSTPTGAGIRRIWAWSRSKLCLQTARHVTALTGCHFYLSLLAPTES